MEYSPSNEVVEMMPPWDYLNEW